MAGRIFRSTLIIAAAVLIACFVLIVGVLYDHYNSAQADQLKTELALASAGVENFGREYLEDLGKTDCRLTLVGQDGSVIYDSVSNPGDMENHLEREEITEALQKGTGESSRYSKTLTEETSYYARRLNDGTVLRVSRNHATIPFIVMGMLQPLIVIFLVTLILSAVLAQRLAKKVVEPLNALDLDKPLDNITYEEISPLLGHIEKQHRKINSQKAELDWRKREFYAVIKNMKEGLVLLSKAESVLSINPAAKEFFEVEDGVGKSFMEIDRSLETDKAIKSAVENGYSELQTEKNGRVFQLNVSRIDDGGEMTGLVILIFDITEKVFAERNRREFTANVSHELKTPLHSIMGSAEIIENGMVNEKDMPRFVGHIRSEASRLLTLIEDIIRLSQLDEAMELPTEEIDLYKLADEEAQSLSDIAKKNNVSISVEGDTTMFTGVRQLTHEIIYNLCDNAIKYNKNGGTVKIKVGSRGEAVFAEVEDTGVGIPKDDLDRVFERFYRVDKSHSKETGGTGLGLSIVKHAVRYMNGSIRIESELGKGTKIIIELPRNAQ